MEVYTSKCGKDIALRWRNAGVVEGEEGGGKAGGGEEGEDSCVLRSCFGNPEPCEDVKRKRIPLASEKIH